MRTRFLFLALGLALAAPAAADQPAKSFAHPDRIRYNGDCFQIEGKDTFIYSAAFHYFRTPRELWRDRLTKIKAAGFNTVETYVPWNWHEREMPKGLDDMSRVDLGELEEFLKMVHEEFGMYSIVRPGPFICAEWAGGAYPRWLAKFAPDAKADDKAPLWLRGADDAHIAWSVHWYKAVCPLFAKEQITRKPAGAKGIIMVQIENEYNHHGTPGKDKVLRALRAAVLGSGVEVPIFTCMTNECRGSMDPELSQVFDSDNYYIGRNQAGDCAHRMATLKQKQPDAPGMVTELQGGWFSGIGGALSEDHYSDAAHFNAIHFMSLLGGATVLNPYMFVGGTHFDGWGARGMTTSYDYNAAIRENGAIGAKYLAAVGVGQFIRDNGPALLHAKGGPCEIKGAPKEVTGGVRVAPDGTRLVFLHNASGKDAFAGTVTLVPGKDALPTGPIFNIDQHGNKVKVDASGGGQQPVAIAPFEVDIKLAPMAAVALVIPPGKSPADGTWYPKPVEPIKRPAGLPAGVRLASALRQEDCPAGDWMPCPAGKSLPELGVSDHRYVRYRAMVNLSAAETGALTQLLVQTFSRDIINARVNGMVAKRTYPNDKQAAQAGRVLDTSHKRIKPDEFDNRFDLTGLLKAGDNELLLVYENIGHEHGYVPMEELTGVNRAGLSTTITAIEKPVAWQVATTLGGVHAGWTKTGFTPKDWEHVALDTTMTIPRKGNQIQPKEPQTGMLTWYRLEFELPAAPAKSWIPWLLRINASGNGYMWLNGQNIGRHNEAGPQREFFLPDCWLHHGPGKKNILMLGLRQTCNGATLKAAEIAPYPDSAEARD